MLFVVGVWESWLEVVGWVVFWYKVCGVDWLDWIFGFFGGLGLDWLWLWLLYFCGLDVLDCLS